MITNGARCTSEIKSRIVTAKAEFKRKKTFFTSNLDLKVWKKKFEVLHLDYGVVWC
jgi:hypothetical protein